VTATGVVTLSGLRIERGFAPSSAVVGGGIYYTGGGTLNVVGCLFFDNRAAIGIFVAPRRKLLQRHFNSYTRNSVRLTKCESDCARQPSAGNCSSLQSKNQFSVLPWQNSVEDSRSSEYIELRKVD
jgi:hypothetical protein